MGRRDPRVAPPKYRHHDEARRAQTRRERNTSRRSLSHEKLPRLVFFYGVIKLAMPRPIGRGPQIVRTHRTRRPVNSTDPTSPPQSDDRYLAHVRLNASSIVPTRSCNGSQRISRRKGIMSPKTRLGDKKTPPLPPALASLAVPSLRAPIALRRSKTQPTSALPEHDGVLRILGLRNPSPVQNPGVLHAKNWDPCQAVQFARGHSRPPDNFSAACRKRNSPSAPKNAGPRRTFEKPTPSKTLTLRPPPTSSLSSPVGLAVAAATSSLIPFPPNNLPRLSLPSLTAKIPGFPASPHYPDERRTSAARGHGRIHPCFGRRRRGAEYCRASCFCAYVPPDSVWSFPPLWSTVT